MCPDAVVPALWFFSWFSAPAGPQLIVNWAVFRMIGSLEANQRTKTNLMNNTISSWHCWKCPSSATPPPLPSLHFSVPSAPHSPSPHWGHNRPSLLCLLRCCWLETVALDHWPGSQSDVPIEKYKAQPMHKLKLALSSCNWSCMHTDSITVDRLLKALVTKGTANFEKFYIHYWSTLFHYILLTPFSLTTVLLAPKNASQSYPEAVGHVFCKCWRSAS